ncbi:MAG: PQQ-binding-like beta-propeller repeat protein [Bryobacteraceae bacterium]
MTLIIARGTAVLTLGLLTLLSAAENTWPQWRGPERSGLTPGPAFPANLQNLKPLWRVELDKGYPGPIVSEDRVFVAETANTDTEIVRALDRKTGKELWRASWPGKISVPFFAKKSGDWIRSTPAFDGKLLFIGGMEEVLVALDASTGKEKWRVDFRRRFGTPTPEFGFASSPLVDGRFLYVQASNALVKLDKATGETIWRTLEHKQDIMESGAFSSPAFAEIGGVRQLLVQSRTHLTGVDPKSGAPLWSQEIPNFRGMNILTPVAFGDSIFTSTYQNNSFLYTVQSDGGKWNVRETWKNKAKGYMSTPVRIGDFVYMHLGNQRFTCMDLKTGESRWTTEPFGTYWSLAMSGDRILALDEAGKLLLIRANPEKFELLDAREISKDSTWGHIAVAGNEIFVRELKAVAAYRWE